MNRVKIGQYVCLLLTLSFPLSCLLGDATTGAGVRLQQLGYGLSCLGWLVCIFLSLRHTPPSLIAVLVTAVLGRALLLPAEISDDVYRYVWEGIIRLHGFNPYAVAPNDPALVDLRPEWWGLINHPNHAGIYPPTAQGIFTVWASVFPDPRAYKYALLVVELLAVFGLLLWLRRSGRGDGWLFVYAICPSTLNAVAREGHLDALLLLGLVILGASTVGRSAPVWAGLGFGLAVGSKWIALLLGPWVLWWLIRQKSPACLAWFALGLGLSFGVPGAFYLQDGIAIWFGPLRHFAENFHSLDFLRQLLLQLLSPTGVRLLSGVVLLSLAGLTLRRDLATAQVWLFGGLLLLSPTLHPWYVTWLLPGLCFVPQCGWLLLPVTLTVAFEGDWHRATSGTWHQPDWVAPGVHVPVYVGLLVFWVLQRAKRSASAA